ncbi:MAG: ChaN family lipoprotein [Candidatus Aminicenantes bacterium]|nr:ChaN family lipoprotein [Candidatus Aminicenantes bacterium]
MESNHRTIVLVFILLLALPVWAAEDNALDMLPLGRSPQRLATTALPAGKIMDTASGQEIDLPALVRQNLSHDVFIIGEYHDSYACHVWQKDFIEALAKEHPRLVVGFEFFNRRDDQALALYLDGKIGEAELLHKTGWYGRSAMNFAYTRLVLETVKKLGLQAVGLNVPRELVRRVAKRGLSSLSPDEQALFPGVERTDPEHEYYVRNTLGEFAVQVPIWFRNIYCAQKCWDTVMAESMRQALARPEWSGYKGVIIAGSAHVAYGLGIPWRYRQQNSRAKIMTLIPVNVADKKGRPEEDENPMVKALAGQLQPAAIFSCGLADAVFAVAPERKPHFAETGFSGKLNAGGVFEVTHVQKASPADKSGLRAGDIILAIDGIPVKTVEGLRLVLAQKQWDDSLELEVRKKIILAKEKDAEK